LIYRGNRILLRECTQQDAALFSAWSSDKGFAWYQPFFSVSGDFGGWWKQRHLLLAELATSPEIEVIVEHIPSGAAIGSIMLTSLDIHRNRKAELSLYFHRGRHTRCVWEALHASMVGAFDMLGLHKLVFHVDSANEAAAGLLKRIGCTKEGVLREEIQVDGMPHDILRFGLLAHEWAAPEGTRDHLRRLAPLAPDGFLNAPPKQG
jgi:RimJ/RimL family protein N-acetyltransferase